MRIAIVVGMFPKISETFIVSQITGLIDRGHEVTIIAKERAELECQADVIQYGLIDRTLYPEPLPAHKLHRLAKFACDWLKLFASDPRRALASLPTDAAGLQQFYFTKLFERREFDVIHCHFGFMGRQVADLKSRGLISCPVLTSFHGTDIGAAASAEEFRQLHEWGSRFTTNSQFLANRAITLGCPAERIDLLPVGVSLPAFRFTERSLGPKQMLRLLTVGRLIASKGIGVAIDAVSRLVERGIDVHYDVVGDGPLRAELELLAPAGHVRFHGALLHGQLTELYRDAHLFILPSVGMEGQGLVLQEAQAMGLPVIASRCCGIPEGIIDGESGILFPEGDSSALAEAILHLRAAHQRWPEIGRAGRALVERKFDIESLNGRLVEIYREAALLS